MEGGPGDAKSPPCAAPPVGARLGTRSLIGEDGAVPPLPFHSSDEFLRAFAEVYFPGAKPAYVTCEGATVRTLLSGNRAISGYWNFPAQLQPVEPPPGVTPVPVPYLENVVVAVTGIDEPGPAGAKPSPFIRWGDFPAWEDYEAFAQARGAGARFASLRRAEKRLGDAHGWVEFREHDRDPALFEQVLTLKREQLDRMGVANRYRVEQNVRFLRMLWERGLLEGSSVRVGGEIAAGRLWHRWGGHQIWRIIAYDPRFAKYSPGMVLLGHMLRAGYEAGDEETEFLSGRQEFKLAYATHMRWLGAYGREPFRERAWRDTRSRASRVAMRAPAAYRVAKRVELEAAAVLRRGRQR